MKFQVLNEKFNCNHHTTDLNYISRLHNRCAHMKILTQIEQKHRKFLRQTFLITNYVPKGLHNLVKTIKCSAQTHIIIICLIWPFGVDANGNSRSPSCLSCGNIWKFSQKSAEQIPKPNVAGEEELLEKRGKVFSLFSVWLDSI